MAEEKKTVILRVGGNNENTMELFIGNNSGGALYIISMEKQLDWLGLIADNIRNDKKRNA